MTDIPLDGNRRDEQALGMRITGVPLHKIAAKFGWTEEETMEAIERALRRVSIDRNPEGVAHYRNLTQQRLDALLNSMWRTATDNSDPVIQTGAVKTVLGIIDRHAALMGTNAPRETVITHQVTPDQVAATIERLFNARSGVIEAEVVRPEITAGEIIEGDVLPDEDAPASDGDALDP